MFYKCWAGSIILHFGITGVIIGAVEGYGNRGLWKAGIALRYQTTILFVFIFQNPLRYIVVEEASV